jgi:hypothetical protein
MTPLPKVSPSKYAPRAAKVRIRIKGSDSEGVLYEGQRVIKPCRNCGKPPP